MMGIYLATVYGVPDNIAKDFAPTTVGQFFDLMEQHKTQEPPATVAEAIAISSEGMLNTDPEPDGLFHVIGTRFYLRKVGKNES